MFNSYKIHVGFCACAMKVSWKWTTDIQIYPISRKIKNSS